MYYNLLPFYDRSCSEKLLKTNSTGCAIFSLTFTKNRLAAGLRPDPLGELKRSPDPLAAIWGPILLREREGREDGRDGRNWKGMEREGWERGGEGKGGEEGRGGGKEKKKEGRGGSMPPRSADPGYGPGDDA